MQAIHRNNFDFIRLSAAIMVWYGHCYALVKLNDPLERAISFEAFGSLGVTIFFIISGYFVTASYNNNKRFLPYMRNRALRILPALFVVVLLSVFVLGPLVTTLSIGDYFSNHITWRYLKCMLIFPLQYDLPGVFTHNAMSAVNGSLWTLQHELRLYIVIALLGVLGILRPRLMLVLLVGLYVIRMYGYVTVPPPEKLFTVKWGKLELAVKLASQFAGGALMYLARDKLILCKKYFVIALLLLGGSLFLPAIANSMLFDIGLTYAVIYLGFLKLPLLPMAGKYGDFSYGFYLYAFPIQQLSLQLLGSDPGFGAFLFTSFVATFLCAILSWHFVENPALSLKR